MIRLENVFFNYMNGEARRTLRNINLTIREGETVVFCGESGCGKTTLTRLINGLVPHYYEGSLSGTVTVKGRDISAAPLYETAELVSSVFQNPRSQFYNVDTVSELSFGCENRGLPEGEILKRLEQTICEFKIESLMSRSIFQLSGGEKQKIACAATSVSSPEVIVLDEPSSNLDVPAIENLKEVLKEWKRKGKTIVASEHRLHYLRDLADRFIYLKEGRIAGEFGANEMKSMSSSRLASLGLRPLFLESISQGVPDKGLPVNAPLRSLKEKIRLKRFHYSYKRQAPVLNMDAVEIPSGSAVAVIGSNGSGKSTFAKCLCGLNKRFRGTLSIGGKTYKGKRCLRSCYMVMQDVNHQLFAEKVMDEVLLGMDKVDEIRAGKILDHLDLLPFKEKHPMALSGGQKQRLAIAGAVAADKEILIFDEPTSGLDLRHMMDVAETIRELQAAGKTLFLVSHDPEFIARCCDYVILLEKGKIGSSYPLDEDGLSKMLDYFTEAAQ